MVDFFKRSHGVPSGLMGGGLTRALADGLYEAKGAIDTRMSGVYSLIQNSIDELFGESVEPLGNDLHAHKNDASLHSGLGVIELFFGEDATDVTNTGGSASGTDIPGTIGTFVVPAGGRPIYADFGVNIRTNAANGLGVVQLVLDGVTVPNSMVGGTSATANASMTTARRKRLTGLTPGEHTCKLQLFGFTNTVVSTARGAGGAPSYLSLTLA